MPPVASQASGLFPVRVQDRYGYIDARGNMRIPPRWDAAGPFREGLACVGTDGAAPGGGGRWGFIDVDGALAIEPRFAIAGDFADGRAAVNVGGRYQYIDRDDSWCFEGGDFGYIDRTGRVVGELRWRGAARFSEGVGAVLAGASAFFVGRNGEPLDWGLFSGTEPFSEGLAAAARLTPTGGYWGWVDARGEFVIPPRYARAGAFGEGLAPALDAKTYTYVFVDRTGAVAVAPPARCIYALPFANGLAAVMLAQPQGSRGASTARRAFGFLDTRGQWAIAPRFEHADSFRDGLARVCEAGRWGFVDARGEPVVPLDLDWATEFVDGIALGLRNQRCHAFRADGSVLWTE